MKFELIQKNSTPQMIVEQILKKIQIGELKVGDKLPPERELTKIFGVGRSSIREAVKALVIMDYLEVIQGKGTFVKKKFSPNSSPSLYLKNVLDAASLFELMEARVILECKVVELAAERADKKNISLMKKALRKMKESKDVKSFLEADLKFHDILGDSTENTIIAEMTKLIIRDVHKHYSKFLAISYNTRDKAISTAERIISLVAVGKGEEAAFYMLEHLNEAKLKIKKLLSEKGIKE